MSQNLVYVLVAVHNRRAITCGFVECLKKQTDQNFKLVLVDDGSTDGTEQAVNDLMPESIIVKGDGNLWWGGAMQKGLEQIRQLKAESQDFVFICNDDVHIEPNFIAQAKSILSKSPKTLLGARFLDRSQTTAPELGVTFEWHNLHCRESLVNEEANCLSTRGLFFRFGDLQTIGYFKPKLLPHYLSDYEFTIRAHQRGFKLMTPPELVVQGDPTPSGRSAHDEKTLRGFWKALFSKRVYDNPFHWTAFILLRCPREHILKNIFRIWRRALWGSYARLPWLVRVMTHLLVNPIRVSLISVVGDLQKLKQGPASEKSSQNAD